MTNAEKLVIGIIIAVLAVIVLAGPEAYRQAQQEYEQCVEEYIDDDTPAFARMAIEDECEDRAFGDD